MNQKGRIPVVGVGASAGGVEALQALFRTIPQPPPHAALVVITHLGSGHESSLPSILADCATIPVLAARDGDPVEPGRAYVLPRDAIMTISGGRLRLRRQDPAARRERQPIDVFFASLADDLGEQATGIVLSGTGSDGTLGLKAIKEKGGLTIAQGTGGTALRYPEMPASAVAGGGVDLILPVEEMTARVFELIRDFDGMIGDERPADPGDVEQDAISSLLRERIGHDFAGYKDKTFFRRVQRRMQVLRLPDIGSYLEHLRRDGNEAGHLFRDLLIGVTGFFRDPAAFAALEQHVIPALFAGRGADETVRVWVSGCATGEEAYSLAMLLREHMEAHPGGPRAKIFATDIDEAALSVARSGRYPLQMITGVSPARLERHFTTDQATYAVLPELRDLCVFSPHSVVRDAPFSRIDLVSCRNLLIYLGGQLQKQILPMFHYALRPGGFLFLGISETIAQHTALFESADRGNRIFRRRLHSAATSLPLPATPIPRGVRSSSPIRQRPSRSGPGGTDARRVSESLVLDRFAPAHVLVNRVGDVVHQSSHLGKYLELAAGAPSRQLLSMARRGLRPALRSALREVVQTGRDAVRARIEVQFENLSQLIKLTVTPAALHDDGEPLFLAVFTDLEPLRPLDGVAADAGNHVPDAAVVLLELELREAREQLQSTIEEYETTAEELKSANEEMVSANEELQSINEELETSKEELQSLNEEMRTTNLELSGKNDALDRANADLRNLFESTQVATIFLDRHLVIRSFTPAVAAIFNLIATDLGRPLSTFANRLDKIDLRQEANNVLDGREIVERRVTAQEGTIHYLMRVLPYRTGSGEVDGVVMTFFDVTKMVEDEVLETLVNELNHRVRNMLQVVQAVAAHTLRNASSLEDFGPSLLGRIRALARAHELVSASNWSEVSLRDLLSKELEPYGTGGASRLILDGEAVRLRPKAALALGMVLHELATNAAKYGALSTEQGKITVTWSIAGDGPTAKILLRWREEGGPAVLKPVNGSGFGSKLIEQQLRHELGGTIAVDYLTAGLRADLTLPINIVFPGSASKHRPGYHP